ncbi:hypothetical protein MRX96_004872 [Rhipicephalus microplus]
MTAHLMAEPSITVEPRPTVAQRHIVPIRQLRTPMHIILGMSHWRTRERLVWSASLPQLPTPPWPDGIQDDSDDHWFAIACCCLVLLLFVTILLMLLLGVLGIEFGPKDDYDSTTTIAYSPFWKVKTPSRQPITRASLPTTTTTTEDSWHYSQDYTQQIWTYLHKYLCPFWADKQGFLSHRRTYGIAFFPYMFCHYAMYCCYSLDENMELQPELPHVDLPPRDAVHRLANFKAENPYLEVWLVVRGRDSVFYKLLANANNEKATFQNNAIAWMRANNYDAIRVWWTNAPDALNGSMAEFYNETNDAFMQHNYTFGFLFPYGYYVRASYNTSKLAHRRAYHTIVLYQEYPRKISNRTKATTYTIQEMRTYSRKLNQTDRPAFCHLFPFVALTYKINPAKCENASIANVKPYNIHPLGYGPPGPLTKMAGILSLPEVCDILDSSWNQTSVLTDSANTHPSFHFACKGEDAIAYTTADDAYDNIVALDHEYEEEVFGVMNPEYDDFPGVCSPPVGSNDNYPIIKGTFRLIKH